MDKKNYLVYLDILGFEELAEKIQKKHRIEARKIRNEFIDIIKKKVKQLEKDNMIIGKKYGESDDWLLVTNTLESIFESLTEILDHHLPFIGYEKIPLEIAIGTGKYDKWARFDGKELIIESPTIEFLRTKIMNFYKKGKKRRVKSTFIVLTESVYQDLEPLDRKICKKVYQKGNKKEKAITFFIADLNKVQRRGKILKFLEKIEYPRSKLYGRIDEVYNPPIGYKGITKMLNKKRIVFITGTQEYGKTFTAVRIMWKYYSDYGYEPRWIKGAEEHERRRAREKLENIEVELKPKHIIYFEDPFGKTHYEKRESLERGIRAIIDRVRKVPDVYVIITSREEVFKEFEIEKSSANMLQEFVCQLNIKKLSYNSAKRKEILLRWAEAENCKWLGNEKLKDLVLHIIDNASKLPTPLSIKDFVLATVSIESENELISKIEEKSKETAEAFAKEIKNMTDDKILFLSFLLISSYSKLQFIKQSYREMVKELNMKGAWGFDKVLNWFKDDKIIIHKLPEDEEMIKFSHDSYFQSLEYLLMENGLITRVNREIFSKLLLKLSEKEEFNWQVVHTIAKYFNNLPDEIRGILPKLSKNEKFAAAIGNAILLNFSNLPNELKELLPVMSEIDEAAGAISSALYFCFDQLAANVRNKLLLTLSTKDKAIRNVVLITLENFEKVPKNIRNLCLKPDYETVFAIADIVIKSQLSLHGYYSYSIPKSIKDLLLKLARDNKTAGAIASAIKHNFGDSILIFSQFNEYVYKLLLTLSEKDMAVKDVAKSVVKIFERIPNELKNKLLLNFSKNIQTYESIGKIVARRFNDLPNNLRNRLLIELSKEDKSSWYVIWILGVYSKKIPKNIKKKIFQILSKKDPVSRDFAEDLIDNLYKIPKNLRDKLLFYLSESNFIDSKIEYKHIDWVAWVIRDPKDFGKIPYMLRKRLLLILSEKGKAWGIVLIITLNFDKIPKHLRNKILSNLSASEDEESVEAAAWAIAYNFDKLPEELRNLLHKLQKPLQQLIKQYSIKYEKGALQLISNVWSKIELSFVLEVLNKLIKSKKKAVRSRAKKMLKDILDKSKNNKNTESDRN